ncbi:MAG: UvrD-helicase domain-containing protein [Bacilli bacterium]
MDLNNLNSEQKKAVTQIDGPLLVLAGAGSGKTKVLTTRIAYLVLEANIAPESILAITFTNKAAKEMKERVVSMLGPIAYKMQISTFHSFGLSVMKEYYDELGYSKNFTILDSEDALTVVKKIMKDYGLDPKIYPPRDIRNKISSAKNEMIDPEQYKKYIHNDFTEKVYKVYKRYQDKLALNNSLDFDDLLMNPIHLFHNNPKILKNYQEKFKYILIDEYQDTNEAQYLLTKMISAKYKNICVVGDNDQSIYSFRGANYKNILNFEKDYKNATIIKLEKNYRSTKNILDVANCVIKNNKNRKEKNLYTDDTTGNKVIYHRSENEKEEAYYVKCKIENLKTNLKNIAVLYRTNAQSRTMEEELLKSGIPYKVVGSIYFYKRKEIKDLISYLNLIYNNSDDVSLLRIINTPKRGIGAKTIENIVNQALTNGQSLFETINSGKEIVFKKMLEDMIKKSETMSLTELVEYVLDKSGIRKELENEKTLEAEVRIENLEEFKSITRNYEQEKGIISLQDFLQELSLVSDVSEYKDKVDVVTLMTVHSAKGLEFDNIFIIGNEEGLFPHKNSIDNLNEIEEERRLFYVAVTRAKKNLYLINAKRRMLYGMENNNPVSRFIKEIDKEILEVDDIEKTIKTSKRTEINKNEKYKIGEKVKHETFGEGIVVSIDKMIVSIAFKFPHGIKKMLAGHKSITKL